MIIIKCDICQKVADDKDFRFEGAIREIKQLLVSGDPRPQFKEKIIHLCKDCFKKKLDL